MEMARHGGLSHEAFDASPHMFTNINSTSPLKHDYPMLMGRWVALRGQPVVNALHSVWCDGSGHRGAITQRMQKLWRLLRCLKRLIRGASCLWGIPSNVDMKSGAPAFGTPEYVRAMQFQGKWPDIIICRCGHQMQMQLMRQMHKQFGSSFSLQACQQGWSNMIYHAAGWLEGGPTASFENL